MHFVFLSMFIMSSYEDMALFKASGRGNKNEGLRRYFLPHLLADSPGAPKQWWFGGGTDLTPAYIFEEDVRHFHSVICFFYPEYLTFAC